MALFCCIPDADTSLNYLVGMIYSNLFQTLYYVADRKYHAVKAAFAALMAGGGTVFVILILIVGIIGGAAFIGSSQSSEALSAEVLAHTPAIQRYASEFGIPEYVPVIQAIMMQESGGRGTDPMQASECPYNTQYPNTPGAIQDADYSIKVGVQYYADCVREAGCESPQDMDKLKLSLQGYNYGNGYISWAIRNHGGYSEANALQFSQEQAAAHPVLVRPSFVLGGRAMQIVAKEDHLRHYLKTAVEIDEDKPVLVDKYICGKEVEIDAICDGTDVFVPGIMELVERTGVHSGDSISVYPTFSISDKIKATILDYAKKLGIGIGIMGLFNIQFIVDKQENVSIIEVNPRSSRTVPFLSKATGYPLADIATKVILGKSLKEQGITVSYPEEKKRWYVKVPAFSFAKLNGMDAYLSPEMKSTGEAIGYDKKLHRAMYKAMIASGMRVQNYGTVIVTLADEDKEEALPLIRRFYDMGFNIEATSLTGEYLKQYGIRTRILRKPSEGSSEILDAIRAGYVSYVINTRAILSGVHYEDGVAIRNAATQNNITMLTSLDTVKVLLDVLEEVTIGVSTIDAE